MCLPHAKYDSQKKTSQMSHPLMASDIKSRMLRYIYDKYIYYIYIYDRYIYTSSGWEVGFQLNPDSVLDPET